MTVAQLIAELHNIKDKSIPVAYACREDNVFGYQPVEEVHVLPAAFGLQVMLESS